MVLDGTALVCGLRYRVPSTTIHSRLTVHDHTRFERATPGAMSGAPLLLLASPAGRSAYSRLAIARHDPHLDATFRISKPSPLRCIISAQRSCTGTCNCCRAAPVASDLDGAHRRVCSTAKVTTTPSRSQP